MVRITRRDFLKLLLATGAVSLLELLLGSSALQIVQVVSPKVIVPSRLLRELPRHRGVEVVSQYPHVTKLTSIYVNNDTLYIEYYASPYVSIVFLSKLIEGMTKHLSDKITNVAIVSENVEVKMDVNTAIQLGSKIQTEILFFEGRGTQLHDVSGNDHDGTIHDASWELVDDRYVLYCDGVDDYAVIPLVVHGWKEIAIEEIIYPIKPKPNTAWSKFSMIGDFWNGEPDTFYGTNNPEDYTTLKIYWHTKLPDGTRNDYYYDIISYANKWVHIIRRFTTARELSYWMNGVKAYAVTIPDTETTILEVNPDTAPVPGRFKRFVLGASSAFGEFMSVKYALLRIWNPAPSDTEVSILFGLAKISMPELQ